MASKKTKALQLLYQGDASVHDTMVSSLSRILDNAIHWNWKFDIIAKQEVPSRALTIPCTVCTAEMLDADCALFGMCCCLYCT